MLEARGLSKTYISDGLEYKALNEVDLIVNQADCVATVGKSGSGKSTLMHLLACLDAPTKGSILLDGNDISSLSERSKNLLRNQEFGFVFQQFFLNGRDTVFENVVLPLHIRGAAMPQITSDVSNALNAVGFLSAVLPLLPVLCPPSS